MKTMPKLLLFTTLPLLAALTAGITSPASAQVQMRPDATPETAAPETAASAPQTLAGAAQAASEPSASRPGLSEGRFNAMLGLGAMTAYGFKRNNKTLMIGGAAATALGYKKWSRRRTDLRSNGSQNPNLAALNPSEEEEYQFRKGRGETAAALALLPAYGIATGKTTYTVAGGAAFLLAYRRYRQTRRERASDHAQQEATGEATGRDAPQSSPQTASE